MAHRVSNHRTPIVDMNNYNICFGALWKVKDRLVTGFESVRSNKRHLLQHHVNDIGCRVSCCCLQDSKSLKRGMIQPEALTCEGVIESVSSELPPRL